MKKEKDVRLLEGRDYSAQRHFFRRLRDGAHRVLVYNCGLFVEAFGIIPSCLQDENMNFNHHKTIKIEQEIKSPSLEILEKIAKALKVQAKDLFS